MRSQGRLLVQLYLVVGLVLLVALAGSLYLQGSSLLSHPAVLPLQALPVDAGVCPLWSQRFLGLLADAPWQLVCVHDQTWIVRPVSVRDGGMQGISLIQLLLQIWQVTRDQVQLMILGFVALPLPVALVIGRRERVMQRRTRALVDRVHKHSGIKASGLSGDALTLLEQTFDRLSSRVQQHRDEVAKAEYADKLTGLANRVQFQQALDVAVLEARNAGQMAALLFIDLDGFKQVNDSFGHSMGDALLVRVAERLRAATRASDLVARDRGGLGDLARLGGDEFTVILPRIHDADAALRVAERIVRALEVPFEVCAKTLSVGASIGIAVFPDDGDTPELLLQKADVAMYRAKSEGKGTYRRYAVDMGKQVMRQHYLSLEMRKALEQAQFYLEFQPIVELPNHQVRYFEALLRWKHPLEGLISPGEFIPIAEESRQILALGDWVLEESMVQLARWQKGGMRRARVSVNVSSVQIRHRNLYAWITDTLKRTGVAAFGVMMEITESCLIDARPETIEQLNALRKDGVSVALDDFGTGYSSLAVLASLPIDVIKIDRSFVAKAATHAKYREVLASIVRLAGQLKLDVVAEGVETAEELSLLSDLGCRLIQGFLISRPAPQQRVNDELFQRQLANLASLGTGIWPPRLYPDDGASPRANR